MPDRFDWIVRSMLSFHLKPLPTKRARRRIPYGTELLARAAQKGVNFGRIKHRHKRAR